MESTEGFLNLAGLMPSTSVRTKATKILRGKADEYLRKAMLQLQNDAGRPYPAAGLMQPSPVGHTLIQWSPFALQRAAYRFDVDVTVVQFLVIRLEPWIELWPAAHEMLPCEVPDPGPPTPFGSSLPLCLDSLCCDWRPAGPRSVKEFGADGWFKAFAR